MIRNFTLTTIYLIFLSSIISAQTTSPGGVENSNTLWLKADQGVTLINQQVDEWAEMSGANITGNFTTITPGAGGLPQNKPGFNPNGINFNPYIVFVSNQTNSISSQNFFTGSDLFTHQNTTLFQVINLKTTTGTGVWLKWQTSNTSNNRLGNEVNNGGANTGRQRFDLRGANLYTTTSITNSHQLITNYTTPNQLGVRLIGSQNNSINATFMPSAHQQSRLTLGNENVTGGDPYPTTIDIAEVIMYNRDLSLVEINKIESYLAVKYGFTLMQTGNNPNDYLASDNTVIWTHANNQNFIHNITGVGRDDESTLYQKQSKSINDDATVTMFVGNMSNTPLPETNANNQSIINADLSFVLFGDNNASLNFEECVPDGRAQRMSRVWKVQNTGNLNLITVGIDENDFPEATQLIVSTEPTFTQNVTYLPLNINGDLLVSSYDLSLGQYFSFTNEPIELNPVVTHLICDGDVGSIVLNPTGGQAPMSYSWTPGNIQTQNLTDIEEGEYTVTVTHGNGCIYTETFTVDNEKNEMYFNTYITKTFCDNSNGSIEIDIRGGTSPYTYSLNNAEQNDPVFNGLSANQYTVKVKDNNGCTVEEELTVGNIDYELELELQGGNAFCDLDGLGGFAKVKVVNNQYPPFTYYWNDFDASSSAVLENIRKGNYDVTVFDENGCTGTGSIEIGEYVCCHLFLPNAFSPNGDGLNDQFAPKFNETVQAYQIHIYNRYGQLVFTSLNPEEAWTGLFNGVPLPVGIYYYQGYYTCMGKKNITEFTGEVTLLR